ncbi:MAG: hypothetical protein ABIK86_07505 [candidate division WOR-3 bacterium]
MNGKDIWCPRCGEGTIEDCDVDGTVMFCPFCRHRMRSTDSPVEPGKEEQ